MSGDERNCESSVIGPFDASGMHMRYPDLREDDGAHFARSNMLLAAAVLASAAVISVPALLLPPALVMPALSGVLIIAAAGVAALAWLVHSERSSPGITCWDISGALYLFACCAGVLSEPEGVLALMEEIRVRR